VEQISLDDMALFVAVARAGSFTQAGINLGMSNGYVSRRIAAHEKQLGVRLFDRNTRQVRLTQPALRFFDRCASLLDELRLTHEALRETAESPAGIVSVSVPVEFGVFWLAPTLGKFAELHPSVKVKIDLSPHQADLITENIDIAIRVGPFVGDNLIAQRLCDIEMGLYASKKYCALHGKPEHPQELAKHRCIPLLGTNSWIFTRPDGVIEIPVDGAFSTNNMSLMLQLIQIDQGIAVLPRKLASVPLRTGELVELLPTFEMNGLSVHALTLSRMRTQAVQVFLDFIRNNAALLACKLY
jgi:DNA-binding transcriptional LysR family regulator